MSDHIETLRTAIGCAHPVTGEEHEAVEQAEAALVALASQLAEAREAQAQLTAQIENLRKFAEGAARAALGPDSYSTTEPG